MKNVIYLHGANADPDNFNYYTLKMPEHPFFAPAYDMEQDPYDLVEYIRMQKRKGMGQRQSCTSGSQFRRVTSKLVCKCLP